MDTYLFKISVQWKQEIRESVSHDESKRVGVQSVSSIAYVAAQSEALAVAFVKDRLQWSSDDRSVAVMSVTQLPLYGCVMSPFRVGGLDETMGD